MVAVLPRLRDGPGGQAIPSGAPLRTSAPTNGSPRNSADRSAREAESDPRKLLGHLGADELERRGRTDHHLELGDQAVLVERELVDPLDLPAVDLGRELQDCDPV